MRGDKDAVAETIENNVRRLIIDESPVNPKYYEKMSELLDALIAQRHQDALGYQEYLEHVARLAADAQNGPRADEYPSALNTPAKRALFNNLARHESQALAVDGAVRGRLQDGRRDNPIKSRRVRNAIAAVLGAAMPSGVQSRRPTG